MDFYDEEHERNYKPSYDFADERVEVLVDLGSVVLIIALIIELIKLFFK
jgi:hypothetical protein